MRQKAGFRFWQAAPTAALLAIGLVALGTDPASAASERPGPETAAAVGSLTGTVATDTGQPVPNALVQIPGTPLQATTRSSGHFTITDVPAGIVQVSVSAPGYLQTTRGDIRVTAGSSTSIQVQLQPTPNFMEQLQVTASKEPLSIGEVPSQANIIDRSQIERKVDLKLAQAIANVPGAVISTEAFTFETILLRGMERAGTTWTTTLLLIDGVPQTDSQDRARSINLPLNDTSRIEVVRGPNSALYGRSAIAGSVNVLTAEPTLEHRVAFDGQLGQFDHLKAQVSASGPIQNWGGYYLSLGSARNHGYYKQSYDFSTKENALFAKFTFTPDSKSHGKVTFNNVLTDNGVATGDPIVGNVLLSDLDKRYDRLSNLNTPTSNYHQEELRTALNYSRQVARWLEFVEVFGYRAIKYKFVDDGDTVGAPFDLTAHTVTDYPFDEDVHEDIFYQDAHFVIKPRLGGIDNSLLVGLSFEHMSGFSTGHVFYTDPDSFGVPVDYLTGTMPDRTQWQALLFGGSDYKLANTGLFGQYIISPTRRLLVNVGGRYDYFTLNNIQTYSAGKPQIKKTFHAFSPKLSATVKLLGTEAAGGKGALNAYAVYSKAFVPPRSPSSLRPLDLQFDLRPENVRNYETGLKGNLLDGKLSLEGTFFKMKRDGIVLMIREGAFIRPANVGVQNYRGVELGVTLAPVRELSFYANAAFYHNRFGEFATQTGGGTLVLTGNRLTISPDRVYNAGATLQHPSGWEATLNLRHIGDVFVDQGNKFKFDPYTVVDASLSWRHDAVRLTLAAHNLFNEEYFNNGDIFNAQYADPAPPRQVVFNASFTFR